LHPSQSFSFNKTITKVFSTSNNRSLDITITDDRLVSKLIVKLAKGGWNSSKNIALFLNEGRPTIATNTNCTCQGTSASLIQNKIACLDNRFNNVPEEWATLKRKFKYFTFTKEELSIGTIRAAQIAICFAGGALVGSIIS
jgi:hypothetical protein